MFNHKQRINHVQSLLTAAQFRKLVANNSKRDQDHAPVVKFFNPAGGATWLISELDPSTGVAFGLCDVGEPELGYVNLQEFVDLRGKLRFGLGIERDLWFKGDHPMSHYVREARSNGRITV